MTTSRWRKYHEGWFVVTKLPRPRYVAAFTVSSYAATAIRAAKPFNPLLGETYELDRREDLGFRWGLQEHCSECRSRFQC